MRIAGVLLIFTYLIVPAVCGINLASGFRNRLLIGWVIALIGGDCHSPAPAPAADLHPMTNPHEFGLYEDEPASQKAS
jgi:hypothetical protein